MYNVKGPSKIVAKTRRGVAQKLDNFREHLKNEKCGESEDSTNGPKPIFQAVYRKSNSKNNNHENHLVMPQQEEIIKYIKDSWNYICTEENNNNSCKTGDLRSDRRDRASVLYYEDEPPTALENFKPFDLESWWGKRLYTYCTNSN